MAKRVPVWHRIYYKRVTIRYLSLKVVGAHGNMPVIRLKKNKTKLSPNTGHLLIIAKYWKALSKDEPNNFFSC